MGSNGNIDGAQQSDGTQVINLPLGDRYPQGLFITQDGDNLPAVLEDGENINTNFKLVPWERVAQALPHPLAIDTSFNPRTLKPLLMKDEGGHDPLLGIGGDHRSSCGEGNDWLRGEAANNAARHEQASFNGMEGDRSALISAGLSQLITLGAGGNAQDTLIQLAGSRSALEMVNIVEAIAPPVLLMTV